MYIIDTNAIVDFYDRYYCPDVFPSLSEDLSAISTQNRVFLISQVNDELETNLHADSFDAFSLLNLITLPENQLVQQKVAEITSHLQSSSSPKLVRNFLSGADVYLIAHAMVHNKKIITNERGQYNTSSKIYIPAVARDFGVEALELVDFFRQEGLTY